MDWDTVFKVVEKLLGQDADIPEVPAAVIKASKRIEAAKLALDKARTTCTSAMREVQDTNSSMQHAYTQFRATIDKSDLGLNGKNKDEAKLITQATKLLLGEIDRHTKMFDDYNHDLAEAKKHLEQLGNYQPFIGMFGI